MVVFLLPDHEKQNGDSHDSQPGNAEFPNISLAVKLAYQEYDKQGHQCNFGGNQHNEGQIDQNIGQVIIVVWVKCFLDALEGNQNAEDAEHSQIQPVDKKRFYHLWRVAEGKPARGIGNEHKVVNGKNNSGQGGENYGTVNLAYIGHGDVQNGQAQPDQYFCNDVEILGKSPRKPRVKYQKQNEGGKKCQGATFQPFKIVFFYNERKNNNQYHDKNIGECPYIAVEGNQEVEQQENVRVYGGKENPHI